jgi:hypothetical protein
MMLILGFAAALCVALFAYSAWLCVREWSQPSYGDAAPQWLDESTELSPRAGTPLHLGGA